ncbi:MAG: HNH/ENDO VII family nuclease [Fimbriimonadaceae bacterium]
MPAVKSPPTKRGAPPIGEDGYPLELHHPNQLPTDTPVVMSRTDHRLGGNFKKNHQNTGQSRSKINRPEFDKVREKFWQDWWDNNMPKTIL